MASASRFVRLAKPIHGMIGDEHATVGPLPFAVSP